MKSFLDNQYCIIALSLLSSKIWDLMRVILLSIINAILWENRTYISNANNTTEFYRLLKKISTTYYICSETRIRHENYLLPTGFILGPNYFCHIKTNLNEIHIQTKDNQTQIIIDIYGWFSIQSLLTQDITSVKKGKYNIIETGIYNNGFYETVEDFPEEHFHKNTAISSKYIYDSVMKQYNNSGTYLLYGVPGTGKTTTARKLTEYFDSTSVICPDIITVSSHENSLTKSVIQFYNKVKPEKNKFLIFVIDEVDVLIDRIFEKKETYSYGKITKQSWNFFLEKILSLNSVILLMTTNKTKDYFDSLDNSLFREYRLTMALQFSHDGVAIDPFVKKSKNE